MIGPVLSRNNGFVPGNDSENPLLDTRPLALISDRWVKFVPFSHEIHNTLAGIQQAVPEENNPITDAFVGAAWLFKGDRPQPTESFGTLFDYDAYRHRALSGASTMLANLLLVLPNLVLIQSVWVKSCIS